MRSLRSPSTSRLLFPTVGRRFPRSLVWQLETERFLSVGSAILPPTYRLKSTNTQPTYGSLALLTLSQMSLLACTLSCSPTIADNTTVNPLQPQREAPSPPRSSGGPVPSLTEIQCCRVRSMPRSTEQTPPCCLASATRITVKSKRTTRTLTPPRTSARFSR